MGDNAKKQAKDFIENADDGCKKCQNFGQSSCPSFQSAVKEKGIDESVLSEAIKEDQKGRNLIPCKNIPS